MYLCQVAHMSGNPTVQTDAHVIALLYFIDSNGDN